MTRKIANAREYETTSRWRRQFAEALDSLNESIRASLERTTPFINQVHRDALVSIITELDDALNEYTMEIASTPDPAVLEDNPEEF